MDVKELFKYYPVLGEQYNAVLKAREKVPPHGSIDREVCAQFTIPVEDLDGRQRTVQVLSRAGGTVQCGFESSREGSSAWFHRSRGVCAVYYSCGGTRWTSKNCSSIIPCWGNSTMRF